MSDSGSLKEEVQPQNGEISSVPVINHLDDVPFNKSPVSAPVETSTATAVAVKPYNPNPSRSITEMTSVMTSVTGRPQIYSEGLAVVTCCLWRGVSHFLV